MLDFPKLYSIIFFFFDKGFSLHLILNNLWLPLNSLGHGFNASFWNQPNQFATVGFQHRVLFAIFFYFRKKPQ